MRIGYFWYPLNRKLCNTGLLYSMYRYLRILSLECFIHRIREIGWIHMVFIGFNLKCKQGRELSDLLTHYQTTNFGLFQTERVCRRKFQIWRKWQKAIQTGRKHCGKKEKLLVTSNFSFSHSVFKRLVSQRRQKVSLCGNGLTHSLINHFETVPKSKKLQTTTEMWLLKDSDIQIAEKTMWKKVKLLILSNFTFFHNVFLKLFSSMCWNE